MIKFLELCSSEPFERIRYLYQKAKDRDQKNIEALAVSSFSKKKGEIFSRYVNLKFIRNNEFIFFSNYESPKAIQFIEHSQVSGLMFWSQTNVQIRIQGRIKKTSKSFNQNYFEKRNKFKKALAISSIQSNKVNNYEEVIKKYEDTLENADLTRCPDYWGGFSIKPYFIEIWEGHKSRLNKRMTFNFVKSKWEKGFLEP